MRPVMLAAFSAIAAIVAGLAAAGAPAATPTQLRVTLWPAGQSGASQSWMLSCVPARGTHPAPGRACLTVGREGLAAFRPVPPATLCTQVYGGPQEALVTGRLRGRPVWARFNLRDGCQIARWKRLAPLLPAAATS